MWSWRDPTSNEQQQGLQNHYILTHMYVFMQTAHNEWKKENVPCGIMVSQKSL